MLEIVRVSSRAVDGRLQVRIDLKGDLPGHPFRGNQWSGGRGGGDEPKSIVTYAADPLTKVGARAVAEYFPRLTEKGDTVLIVNIKPDDDPMWTKFEVGGNTFKMAGNYHKGPPPEVNSQAEPGILAHEFGHDEFYHALDNIQEGMNEAARNLAVTKQDPFERGGFFRMDGDIREPANASEQAYNALEHFKSSLKTEKDHPTEYSSSYIKENIHDTASVAPESFYGRNSPSGEPHDYKITVQARREINEAYAEFCRGEVLDKMVKDGLAIDMDGRPSLKKMGTPESRAAFKELRKAIAGIYKEKRK